jgi:uncharacterized protein
MNQTIKIIALVVALAPTAALPASFDCTKSSTLVERAICNDTVLSTLDDTLDYNFERMQGANLGAGALADLRETQRAWLALRNNCKSNDCLMRAYEWRIDAICEYPVRDGEHPGCTTTDEVLEIIGDVEESENDPGFRF